MNIDESRRLLELPSNFAEDDLKRAYRSKALELHPDRHGATLEAHWSMIELNQAHNLLLAGLRQNDQADNSGARNTKSPQDYDLYKRAMTSFRRIHPSIWIKTSEVGLFDRSGNVEKLPVTEGILEALASMSTAFSLFSQVVNDFPLSPWRADSSDKLAQLEKMATRYKAMLKNTK